MAIAGIATGSKYVLRADARADLGRVQFPGSSQTQHGQARFAKQRDRDDDGQWRSRYRYLESSGTDVARQERWWPRAQVGLPAEGTIGDFIDCGDDHRQGRENKPLVKPFLDAMQKSE